MRKEVGLDRAAACARPSADGAHPLDLRLSVPWELSSPYRASAANTPLVCTSSPLAHSPARPPLRLDSWLRCTAGRHAASPGYRYLRRGRSGCVPSLGEPGVLRHEGLRRATATYGELLRASPAALSGRFARANDMSVTKLISVCLNISVRLSS